MGFNYPYAEGEQGMTIEELDATFDRLMDITYEATGAEVQICKSKTNYLYETRFKTATTLDEM
jgi:hypothetical protein